jgi:NTP pyrophosphatase (non-canonical NTP hydrolase)
MKQEKSNDEVAAFAQGSGRMEPSVEARVIAWAQVRGIFAQSDPKTQALKTVSEVGELADSVAKGRCVKDDIGDIMVTLVLLAEMHGTTLGECLQLAWDEIKDRKGEMVNGTFVKEGDV